MFLINKTLEFISLIGFVIISLCKGFFQLLISVLFSRPKKSELSKKKRINITEKLFHLLLNIGKFLVKFVVFIIKKLFSIFKIFTIAPKTTAFVFGAIFSIIFIFVPFVVFTWFRELPSPDLLIVEANRKSTRILDRNGELLYEIYVDRNYNPVEIEQIPNFVIQATLAVEDDKFYEHNGVRLDSIIRATKKIIFEDTLQGGSTVTQQLVKNVLLTPERTFSRKLKEGVLALMVEAKYSKEEILEMYLNNIPYGGTSWGIQSASEKYFGKNVWDLSLAEASLLAGLPTAPTLYSPLTDINYAKNRQKYVLDRMVFLGFISKEELEVAYSEELNFIEQKGYIRAPHFVNFIRKDLEERYGKRFVELGGLTVTTTLDIGLYDKVQKIVAEEVEKNSYLGFSNGASVVMDVKSGEILAYVGSIDYFKEVWGAYDVVTALRQPGSSIKPVTYGLALSGKFTPASIINDSPVTYRTKGSPDYTPVNYDGRFHGKVTLRQALANSYNIPAVKIAREVGVDNIALKGKEMGLTNWDAGGSYGLSITLGGKEVRLLDHTNLYATLARGGVYKEPKIYLSIKDSKGHDVYFDNRIENQVISNEVSYLLWDILSDNRARLPAFGVNNFLSIPGHKVAVKTGTTDNIKDNWTMGYTPSYVVGVWVGNNDGQPMRRGLASGLTGAAPIWNRIMSEMLQDKPNEVFIMPENVFVKKDEKCGFSEVFIEDSNVPKSLCRDKEDKEK
ncbi:PBP1A family penicillin-binding protein [Patescibacteria group bacterium]|nr:PBP1A family penicillin-binding protein [Patescibacteria group bacterium]